MESGGFAPSFETWVSSEEVARGKPAPDVFLEAARRLGVDPATTAAIEDSHNGILSAARRRAWPSSRSRTRSSRPATTRSSRRTSCSIASTS